MDRGKLDRQLDRKISNLETSIAVEQDRKPIEEYDKFFFTREIYYEGSLVEAKIIKVLERFNTTVSGVYLDGRGPWILFRLLDVIDGDPEGLLDLGSAILARWNNGKRIYTKYIGKSNPQLFDKEVVLMSTLMGVEGEEIVNGKL